MMKTTSVGRSNDKVFLYSNSLKIQGILEKANLLCPPSPNMLRDVLQIQHTNRALGKLKTQVLPSSVSGS